MKEHDVLEVVGEGDGDGWVKVNTSNISSLAQKLIYYL